MNKLLDKILQEPLNLNDDYAHKILINTCNSNSLVVSQRDSDFQNALLKSDILLPDGVGALIACRFIQGRRLKKISGYDLFLYEMEKLNRRNGKCFFLGSTEHVLGLIKERAGVEYPNVGIRYYSPPYKKSFSSEENQSMISVVNSFSPDVLFVGMTAPKQEKWAAEHFEAIDARHICSIGAVFDFYAGTVKRAPRWMINIGLEWFYRLIKEPGRMWRRYLIGNTQFLWLILKEKFKNT